MHPLRPGRDGPVLSAEVMSLETPREVTGLVRLAGLPNDKKCNPLKGRRKEKVFAGFPFPLGIDSCAEGECSCRTGIKGNLIPPRIPREENDREKSSQ